MSDAADKSEGLAADAIAAALRALGPAHTNPALGTAYALIAVAHELEGIREALLDVSKALYEGRV